MTARTRRDPGQLFDQLTGELGRPFYERIDAPATPAQKNSAEGAVAGKARDHGTGRRAGSRSVLTAAPGNGQPFGGIKVATDNGWFAARPSGTEDVYKIYAESFRSEEHLRANPAGRAGRHRAGVQGLGYQRSAASSFEMARSLSSGAHSRDPLAAPQD